MLKVDICKRPYTSVPQISFQCETYEEVKDIANVVKRYGREEYVVNTYERNEAEMEEN